MMNHHSVSSFFFYFGFAGFYYRKAYSHCC